jgi:uncharacterized membrane protein YeaQ/YmgE (transglycosylase-associated protein family)
VLGTILSIVISGTLIGLLARWGVPGPDPMPLWLTFLFGLGGSVIGGAAAAGALGATKDVSSSDYFAVVLASILAAMVPIILYRRFVQGRPITGPEAHQPPTKGIGVSRRGGGRGRFRLGGPTKSDVLELLDDLHDRGVLTDEEYVEKRRKVLRGE